MPIKRIACAISGGVDSAVSALLLKRRGLDVVGVYMVNWDHQDEDEIDCPNTKDLADARLVCQQLDIQLHVVNFVKEYWNSIFLDFLENYKKGRTVIPDIGCNQHIKFNLLHKFAFEKLDVDAVATGHFARNSQFDLMEPGGSLLKAHDKLKCQTYFLSRLTSSQLMRSVFPVGNMLKSEVKSIAMEVGLLNVLEKKESMGICFIGKKRNFDDFLLKYIEPIKHGRFVDSDTGKVLKNATHSGVHNFTLGKRVAIDSASIARCEQLFVSGYDVKTQTIYVCRGSHHPVLYATKFVVSKVHWIEGDDENQLKKFLSTKNFELECRIQRIHPTVPCCIHSYNNSEFIVEPKIPIRAAAAGQNCVFYMGDKCLGCAEIEFPLETLAKRQF